MAWSHGHIPCGCHGIDIGGTPHGACQGHSGCIGIGHPKECGGTEPGVRHGDPTDGGVGGVGFLLNWRSAAGDLPPSSEEVSATSSRSRFASIMERVSANASSSFPGGPVIHMHRRVCGCRLCRFTVTEHPVSSSMWSRSPFLTVAPRYGSATGPSCERTPFCTSSMCCLWLRPAFLIL